MPTKFGQFIEKRALSKAKLAEKSGLTRQRLSELSIRENSKIRLDEACAISKALEIPLDDLCKELGEGV
jgi:DNA-binding Xre family transcriptional regulator